MGESVERLELNPDWLFAHLWSAKGDRCLVDIPDTVRTALHPERASLEVPPYVTLDVSVSRSYCYGRASCDGCTRGGMGWSPRRKPHPRGR